MTYKERKKEYNREYMQNLREQERKDTEAKVAKVAEATRAKIEEMTETSYENLEYKWCVEARMAAGESREEAERYANDMMEDNAKGFLADAETEVKRPTKADVAAEIESEVDVSLNPFNDPGFSDAMRQNYEDIIQYCIKKRTVALGSLYSPEHIEKYCREMLPKADSLSYGAIFRQKERETGNWSSGTVDQEYADRVYSMMAILGLDQRYCERYVKTDMISEGKLADLKKRTYSRTSVGDLYGKTRAEIAAMDATVRRDRTTVGDLQGKTKEQIIKEDAAAENAGFGLRDTAKFVRSNRLTVGNLYGKNRREIQDMDKDQK